MEVKNEGTTKDLDELEQAYLELGKLYYEYKFEAPTPELLPLFDKITRIKNERKAAEEEIFCPQCGNRVKQGALFCGNCGYKLNA